jgi:hypothetical protein
MIECVGPLAEDCSRLLWSMKFRNVQSTKPEKLKTWADSIRRLCAPADWIVFAVLNDESTIDCTTLPPRTIVIGINCLRRVFSPFGASFLLTRAEDKLTLGHESD